MVRNFREVDKPTNSDIRQSERPWDISNFIDSHIREVQYTLYFLGTVTIAVMFRRISATKIIVSANDIPHEFITKGARLKGNVQAVGSQGTLYVQHIPLIGWRPERWKKSHHVAVSLAMVDMTPHSSKWVLDNLHLKNIWFQILSVDDPEKPLSVEIFYKKSWRNFEISVNEKLVSLGLCKINYPPELRGLTSHQSQLLDKLSKAQAGAVKANTGLWQDKNRSQPNKFVETFKSGLRIGSLFIMMPIRFIRKISKFR